MSLHTLINTFLNGSGGLQKTDKPSSSLSKGGGLGFSNKNLLGVVSKSKAWNVLDNFEEQILEKVVEKVEEMDIENPEKIKDEIENDKKQEQKVKQEEEALRVKLEQEFRHKIEQEARVKQEEEALRVKLEEEVRHKIEQEQKVKQEQEALRVKLEEEVRHKIEQEARVKQEQEALRVKLEQEVRHKIEQEQKVKQEQEALRVKLEEEVRHKIEQEARVKQEQEALRVKLEEEARHKIEQEQKVKQEEEERARIKLAQEQEVKQEKLETKPIESPDDDDYISPESLLQLQEAISQMEKRQLNDDNNPPSFEQAEREEVIQMKQEMNELEDVIEKSKLKVDTTKVATVKDEKVKDEKVKGKDKKGKVKKGKDKEKFNRSRSLSPNDDRHRNRSRSPLRSPRRKGKVDTSEKEGIEKELENSKWEEKLKDIFKENGWDWDKAPVLETPSPKDMIWDNTSQESVANNLINQAEVIIVNTLKEQNPKDTKSEENSQFKKLVIETPAYKTFREDIESSIKSMNSEQLAEFVKTNQHTEFVKYLAEKFFPDKRRKLNSTKQEGVSPKKPHYETLTNIVDTFFKNTQDTSFKNILTKKRNKS